MYPVKGASLARLDLLDIDLIPADEMRARALAERARFAVLHRGVGAAAVLAQGAGGGDSQHHAHGQRLLDLGGAGEEIPEIPLVQRAEADGLGGVDDTAAAQCQQSSR